MCPVKVYEKVLNFLRLEIELIQSPIKRPSQPDTNPTTTNYEYLQTQNGEVWAGELRPVGQGQPQTNNYSHHAIPPPEYEKHPIQPFTPGYEMHHPGGVGKRVFYYNSIIFH